jgi:hypothetical protein
MRGMYEMAGRAAAAGGASWVALDFTSWTVTDGSVADLVTAVDGDSITVADIAADIYAKQTRLISAIAVAAGENVDIWIERTDPTANDRIGFMLGLTDGGSVNAAAGCGNSGSGNERHYLTGTGFTSASLAGCAKVRLQVAVEQGGDLTGFSATYYDASGNWLYGPVSGTSGATPAATLYLCCWVRHGGSTGLGAQDIDYSGRYLLTSLTPS